MWVVVFLSKNIKPAFSLMVVLIIGFFMALQTCQAFYLDEYDDEKEIMYEDHEFNNSPFPTWQQYPADQPPEPKVKAEAAENKPSLLKRLFNRAKKQVSLPIELVPKINEDQPRELVVNLAPILRLPQAIRYGAKTVMPGFYQARLTESQGQAQINLYQQQLLVLSVPCQVKLQAGQMPQPSSQSASSIDKKVSKPTAVMFEDYLMLNFAQDGEYALLQYKDTQNGRLFEGMPLPLVK